MPHYRKDIYNLLNNEFKLTFAFGNSKSGVIQTINKSWNIIKLKNVFFKNRLIYQRGLFKHLIFNNYDAIILLGEFQILSNWSILLLKKLNFINCKVYSWGHGVYGNENSLILKSRILFLSFFDKNFIYNNRSRILLESHGLKNCVTIYNSLPNSMTFNFNDQHDFSRVRRKHNFSLLFIGRLTTVKNLDLLLNAIFLLKDIKVELKIVGDGYRKSYLKNLSGELLLQDQVKFYKGVYDKSKLIKHMKSSHIFISPGNIGLSVITALSAGLPVITHNSFEHQMPEFEILNKDNSYLFVRDDINSLANCIRLAHINFMKNELNPITVSREWESKYNVINQLNTFKENIYD